MANVQNYLSGYLQIINNSNLTDEKDYLEIFPDSKIGVLVCYGIDNHAKEEEKYAPYLREAEKQAAALAAAETVFMQCGRRLPVMLSVTVSNSVGRMLSGQSIEAFIGSVAHHAPLSIGLNCSFGAEQMIPVLRELSTLAPLFTSAYPNAGLPDAMGKYSQTPDMMAAQIYRMANEGLVNIVGGCCGSTPDHIRAIAARVANIKDIRRPGKGNMPWLAGLDGFMKRDQTAMPFINVGERCNVAGSRKFLRLIKEGAYDEAVAIARAQVQAGAMVLDINMDDALLDATAQMTSFLRLMGADPDIARVPWMIDSSRFEVIEQALKNIQGKAIVNSLSLKEGEALFVERAAKIKRAGAALIVMCFDEQGQATTFERKCEIAERAYRLLTERVQFDPHDIIFDPNVLTIATGVEEHNNYALDFIRATEWIKTNLKGCHVTGGISNEKYHQIEFAVCPPFL